MKFESNVKKEKWLAKTNVQTQLNKEGHDINDFTYKFKITPYGYVCVATLK